ncbi:glucose PTS transporter subunit IIA [Streptococcus moroccensis]|uniref:PTS system beta-glucosides-specific IIC component n=1 Tax=Streptococcus moroccensis TaxID=1451356 RepID=A0ABT9YSH3_9STRE|nr:glucose PTS transporter subunit IIA [Streptococcus moroccensis]MDQ0222946.1 PTS system beta-glucosides-specific IIC component [Streptococcus moroccensis]
MVNNDIKNTIILLAGDYSNVINEHQSKNILTLKVKDRSVVQVDEIEKLDEVTSISVVQNRIRILLIKKHTEEDGIMSKKRDFKQLASTIVENVGGKDNINGLRHCITRLRFRLKDENLANKNVLENTDGIISVVKGGGEYMVVIGNDVVKAYDAVNDVLGISEGQLDQHASSVDKQNPIMKVINAVVGAVMPALNFICAGGVLKGLLTILSMTGLLDAKDGLYILINAMGDAVFFFLPIILGYNFAKHMKGDPFLGLVIGAILCYPAVNGVDLKLFGIATKATYTSSFLPVIAITAIAVIIERFLKKYIPSVVSGFLVPVITLLIVIPLGFALVGPFVNEASNAVNAGLNFLLGSSPIIAGLVFGGLYQVMVLFGIHQAATSISFMNVLSGKPDQIMAMGVLVCFAQVGVVLAIYLKTKDKKLKGIALPAVISGLFGITEPAIYGVTLPRLKMFIISCIGGALTGAFIMATGVTMYSFTGLGLVTFLGLVSPKNPDFILPIIAALIGFVFSFVATFALYKDNDSDLVVSTEVADDKSKDTVVTYTVKSPLAGIVHELTEVPDQVFASGALGNGVAIQPETNVVYAPADATVTALMPSKHAIGLTLDNGAELLIHVGINTVNLNGLYYDYLVKENQKVKAGEQIMTFDRQAIEAVGYKTITPIIITNSGEFGTIAVLAKDKVEVGDLLLDFSK